MQKGLGKRVHVTLVQNLSAAADHDVLNPNDINKVRRSNAAVEEPLQIQENNENNLNPSVRKKSVSFKLAFVGLALVLLTISGELKGTSLESLWANLGYSLCGLVMQPVWASVSDVFGRKYPFHASVGLFFVCSIVFATAQNMKTLIAGRLFQGFGGGGIDVLVSVVLADITALEERSKYLGIMAIPSAVGNNMGPFVGALFSTYTSWRWIGWIKLPLLGVGTILLSFFLKLRAVPLDATLISNLSRLDWVGVVMLVVFAWYESKPAAPIIPRRLFQTNAGNMALVGGFIHGMVFISLLQYLPLFYQAVQLKTAISSAIFLLPTVIISVLVTAVSMMMVPMFGGYKWLLVVSWVVTALGSGLLALFGVEFSTSVLYGLPILWGQGVSLLRILMLPVQASVKHVDDEGLATANFLTIRMFGALVGLAICSPIFNIVFSNSVAEARIELTGSLAPLKNASNAVSLIGELRSLDVPAATLKLVSGLYLESFKAVFYTMAALSGLGLLSSIFLDEIELKRKDLGNQRFEDH
ncbi:MFS general substrate transporter [Paraphaeosphaeria sporulosa]|uniref:MFS general substrate transporter n=1 Tax=Paraphaeosphaeria sporulosa TaxID=1460663 RepID=A0A177BY66_9PLEO|nr:MFS general substrate transporter [Paraphaeosphaeria sporulosa]OAF99628.1 MFS general substrate transporter [Paraphaeosphaeria sporulosa]